jgi:hypothetical protein
MESVRIIEDTKFIIIHQYVGFPGEGYKFSFTDVESHLVNSASTLYRINNNNNVTDLINTLPDNSSVNTVQHATIDWAVFYAVRTEQQWNNGVMQPASRQWLRKHISTNRTML